MSRENVVSMATAEMKIDRKKNHGRNENRQKTGKIDHEAAGFARRSRVRTGLGRTLQTRAERRTLLRSASHFRHSTTRPETPARSRETACKALSQSFAQIPTGLVERPPSGSVKALDRLQATQEKDTMQAARPHGRGARFAALTAPPAWIQGERGLVRKCYSDISSSAWVSLVSMVNCSSNICMRRSCFCWLCSLVFSSAPRCMCLKLRSTACRTCCRWA